MNRFCLRKSIVLFSALVIFQIAVVRATACTASAGTVLICSPAAGSSVTSPVHITAASNLSPAAIATAVYVDFVKQYSTNGPSVDTTLTLSAGSHHITVQSYNGAWVKSSETFAVSSSGGTTTGAVPQSDHVFVLLEENHSYEQVIGNSSMPYFNSLAKQYAVAANYDANSHYSLPNYFWITAGAYVTLKDSTTLKFDVDNVTRYLNPAGKTWKAYEESLPSVGYVGASQGYYEKNHDPFSYFTDVANSSEAKNIVPFTQLASDLSNGNVPNYSFITPNGLHDGHDGGLSTADTWLKNNIGPLLASPLFQPGGDGILFITFDESTDSDCRPLSTCPSLPENGGGGRVATLIISPLVKPGYKSGTFYQHPNVLKTMLMALGISGAPGAAQNAKPMSDVFQGTTTSTGGGGCLPSSAGVLICSPASGSSVSSPVTVTAGARAASGNITAMRIYVDGVAKFSQTNSSNSTTEQISTALSIPSGTHSLSVIGYQSSGGSLKSSFSFTVK